MISSCFVVTLVAAAAIAGSAGAQTYPTQDLHFICAYPAGSSSDSIVRFLAEKIRPQAGRIILVENKPGANGNLATEFVARAKPDGHTILIHAGSALAANMHLFKNPPVDVATAIQVAGTINRQAFMLAVDSARPWKTLAELTAAMKEKGDKASYATYAATATIMGELYKRATGVRATEVGYRVGADTLNDLSSGALDYGIYDPPFAMSQARNGKLRLLAVGVKERLNAAPDIPTMQEEGIPDVDLPGWFAAMVPSATPKPVVDQISKWAAEAVRQDATKQFLNGFGSDPWISSPDQGQARLISDIKDWGEYVRMAKIVPQG
ncbi:MAG: tripartite tricarboxylate transporter substrate binding protein [Xanthobacteraceae bacterium]|nr:tripartite tricarboxylate transporter substrate binding protein [Xanthobacteraceae bacterium]